MKIAPLPIDEAERLKILQNYHVLDSYPEQDFDNLTFLASQICKVPIALISLVDLNRQWIKSKVGLNISETPRDFAFCSHAILQADLFLIPDSLKDERFHDNPLVTGFPYIRFYAGVPLQTTSGHSLGTICVIDKKPRILKLKQIEALKALARHVVKLFELRLFNLFTSKGSAEIFPKANLVKEKKWEIRLSVKDSDGFEATKQFPIYFGNEKIELNEVRSTEISFDKKLFLGNFSGIEGFYITVINSFLFSLPKLLSNVGISIMNNNTSELEIASHTLKGALSYLFAEPTMILSAKLEKIARDKNIDEAWKVFQELKDKIVTLEIELKELIHKEKIYEE